MASSAGQYEGNPIIPAIYANSKHKHEVSKYLSLPILVLATYIIISSPLSILAFGNKIQEIIFMNLDSSGGVQFVMVFSFTLLIISTIGMNFIPVVHIV